VWDNTPEDFLAGYDRRIEIPISAVAEDGVSTAFCATRVEEE
jgi:hypothetical protein